MGENSSIWNTYLFTFVTKLFEFVCQKSKITTFDWNRIFGAIAFSIGFSSKGTIDTYLMLKFKISDL